MRTGAGERQPSNFVSPQTSALWLRLKRRRLKTQNLDHIFDGNDHVVLDIFMQAAVDGLFCSSLHELGITRNIKARRQSAA